MSQRIPNVTATTEVEEVVTNYTPPNNGSGPLWNAGSPILIRQGASVFASALETGVGVPPMSNVRWQLWRRDADGWALQQMPPEYREREACPLVQYDGGRIFLSINPSIDATVRQTSFMGEPTPEMQYCSPHLLEFAATDPQRPPACWLPRWSSPAQLRDHSYRGIATDPEEGELVVFHKDRANMDYVWSFLDKEGRWSSQGRTTTPVNACYPVLSLRKRVAHAVTIGDIIEPVKEWLDYKWEHQKRRFFFVFRRVFYTWTPDIATQQFAAPLEVDSVEDTAGWMWPVDQLLDAEGRVHLLCLKQNIASTLMRDRFFPGQPMISSLTLAVLARGQIMSQRLLVESDQGGADPVPVWARLHATPDGQMYVVGAFTRNGALCNAICTLSADGEPGALVPLSLDYPFRRFFTATERGGTLRSHLLDLYGEGEQECTLRYARVRLG